MMAIAIKRRRTENKKMGGKREKENKIGKSRKEKNGGRRSLPLMVRQREEER